jgi:hypothetical protein
MNVVELEQCYDAANRRIRALMGDGDSALLDKRSELAVFAGTGLPGPAVAELINVQALDSAQFLNSDGEFEPWQVLRACAMNTFWLGFECGRRSK